MHPTSLPLLHFDANPDAVINPFRDEGYQFPQRMLFAFISAANILKFVEQYPHTIVGTFETVSNEFHVYQLDVDGHQVGLCRAPLGASAATQLLEFLIAYGAQRIVTVGSCGVLTDAPENQFMVVTAALRDEVRRSTTCHPRPASRSTPMLPATSKPYSRNTQSRCTPSKRGRPTPFFSGNAGQSRRAPRCWLHRCRNGVCGPRSLRTFPRGAVRPDIVHGRLARRDGRVCCPRLW